MQGLLIIIWIIAIGALVVTATDREREKPNGWVTTFSFIGIALLVYLGGAALYALF